MIIRTETLHKFDTKLFSSDRVHLKPAGRGKLCVAYKKHVYPKLGMEYTEPSQRDNMSSTWNNKANKHNRSYITPRHDRNDQSRHQRDRNDQSRYHRDRDDQSHRGGYQQRNQPPPHDTDRMDRIANMLTSIMREMI